MIKLTNKLQSAFKVTRIDDVQKALLERVKRVNTIKEVLGMERLFVRKTGTTQGNLLR